MLMLGYIDQQEFRAALEGFNLTTNEQTFQQLVALFDSDHDGRVNYTDFIDTMVSRRYAGHLQHQEVLSPTQEIPKALAAQEQL